MSKVLIIVTNHTKFDNSKAAPTGLWLSELTHFYDVFEAAGIAMDIVSPKGGRIHVDGRSLGFFVMDKATKKRRQDPAFMTLLENTKSISDVNWATYDVVYFAGGHGAMWDFAENSELHAKTADFYEGGKVVSAVCHGVAALQEVLLSDGTYLIDGKRGTGFSYFDEGIAGVKRLVPYNMEQRLKDRGLQYSKAMIPLAQHTVVDERLITGQNPNSATVTAERTLEEMKRVASGT
ncbi:Putative intracellular protease/amidase [Shimia sagamensis]|uniref:Intracellular protease/amidase n=2 Tax=Shimia sagamensis TaxID=1566352 RepID=A0ABY1P867_9RHOB|nr:Putative intracellular protease/amidase [Shimia sagamensis]